ncbi:hypothetical protein AB0I77_42535 [Streptomyces sp. NPDC050619]|uniref:hypothetical protein n=1 Tax=Streptomyces sp. NPDC050619 TaxID=3157214 RepID=UPI00341E6919
MSDATTALQAAKHAGWWKADHGQAPHYSRAALDLWPCFACPLDDCDWHHDDDTSRPSDPALLEAKVLKHLAGHDVVDVLRSLQATRDATVAVRESNNRAWDVVNLHRVRYTAASTPTPIPSGRCCPRRWSAPPSTTTCAANSPS